MDSLTSLANRILAASKAIEESALARQDSKKSDDLGQYVNLPKELEDIRDNLINDCARLRLLVETPETALRNIDMNWTDLLSLRVICHFQLFNAVPVGESASYKQIADTSGVSEPLVFRFIRIGILNGIFTESSPGRVCHTPRSRWLADNPGIHDMIAMQFDDFVPASTKYIEAIEKFGNSQEPEQAPFTLANGGHLPFWAIMAQDPARRQRFGRAMQHMTSADSWDLKHVLAAFDWHTADQPGATVIDVGGGLGHLSAFLATNTHHLRFIVQDLPQVVVDAEENKDKLIPTEITNRLEFVVQNFLEPQKATWKADIIIMRFILHDWSDKYAVKILQNLVPALKPGTKILLFEYVLGEDPVTNATDTFGIKLDTIMGVGFNAKERTSKQYQELMKEADKGFVWKRTERPAASSLSVVEAVWEGN